MVPDLIFADLEMTLIRFDLAANIWHKLFANIPHFSGAVPPPAPGQKTSYSWGDAARPTMAIGAGVGALGLAVVLL